MPIPRIETLLFQDDPEKLFGSPTSATYEERLCDLQTKYRGFSLVLPVDPPGLQQRLDLLYAKAQDELNELTLPRASVDRKPADPQQIITAFPGEYSLGRVLWQDPLCDMLACRRTLDGETRPCMARLACEEGCNGFIQREAFVLNRMGADQTTDDPFHSHFRRYLPHTLGTFTADCGDEGMLNGVLLEDLTSFRNLEEVREAFPRGVEFQTAVWIFNRLLEGLGYAHSHLVIHGGIVPCNVLIEPTDHAAKIIGWNGAAVDPMRTFERISLKHDDYEDFYPMEVSDKESPTPATDIYMAAKCMVYILNGDMRTNRLPQSVPDYLRNFLRSCLIAAPAKRPDSAWELRREFDGFMRNNYGPPRYHKFEMRPRLRLVDDDER